MALSAQHGVLRAGVHPVVGYRHGGRPRSGPDTGGGFLSPTGKPGRTQKMRAVSLPDELWDEAEEVARQLNMSRSEMVRSGLKREISLARARLRKQGATT